MADRHKPGPGAQGAPVARRRARGDRGGAGGAVRASAPSDLHSGVGAAGERSGLLEIQRARILAALVEVAGERGAARVTVAHIVTRSGVSRRTFYELFEDRDACFLAAFDDAVARGAARVVPAFRDGARDGDWCGRVREGLHALLEFLDDDPDLGRMCLVDSLGAGPAALERRMSVVAALVAAVDEGRREAKRGMSPTRLTAEGVVGGVLAVLYARLVKRKRTATVGLLNQLIGMVVLPYLGQETAAREVARAAPKVRRPAARGPSNPLAGLEMRLTYRTMRALLAIDLAPGASNRQVADAAEVQDQGQISKLLTRLKHVGLIENGGSSAARGEPNAWQLTVRGHEVASAIHQQTPHTDG